mgnify:CR=1 FL=1
MTNLDILSAKKTISDYLGGLPFPSEIKRMIVKEVYEDIQKTAYEDSLKEIEKADKEVK